MYGAVRILAPALVPQPFLGGKAVHGVSLPRAKAARKHHLFLVALRRKLTYLRRNLYRPVNAVEAASNENSKRIAQCLCYIVL